MDDDIYELHVCERGRWSCAERFRAAEREEAIAEAQRHFASPSIEAVRVIREAFDQNEQVFKQRTIFRSAKPKTEGANNNKVAPVRRAPPAAPARPPPRSEPATPPPRPPEKPAVALGAIKRSEPRVLNAAFGLVKRLLIAAAIGAVLTGLFVAVLISGAAAPLLQHISERTIYAGIVLLFVASFFLSLYLFSRANGELRIAR